MEMTVKEVLIAARAKIADPANWTQGSFAKDIDGCQVWPWDEDATCLCAMGAIAVSVGGYDQHSIDSVFATPYFDALSEVMGAGDVVQFNDTHTHAEVLAKFDEAIAAQGGE